MNGPRISETASLDLSDVRMHFTRISSDGVVTLEEITEHLAIVALVQQKVDAVDAAITVAVTTLRRGLGSESRRRQLEEFAMAAE